MRYLVIAPWAVELRLEAGALPSYHPWAVELRGAPASEGAPLASNPHTPGLTLAVALALTLAQALALTLALALPLPLTQNPNPNQARRWPCASMPRLPHPRTSASTLTLAPHPPPRH